MACGTRCKQATAFSVSILFLILSLLIIFLWERVYNYVLYQELTISTDSRGFQMWKETPIPMYLSIYLYNWTNAAEVIKDWRIKPRFVECGPYVYKEHHSRVNLEWYNNSTVLYQQNRTWIFDEEKTNGSLDDEITNLNVIAMTVAYAVKDKNILIKKGVDFFLKEKERSLILTKKVREWIFDGYEDEMLELLKKLNITSLNIPFNKFGWFYGRNGSATYDGNFTMYTGVDDLELLGLIEMWNGDSRTSFYSGYCGWVNGTSGELWPPVENYDKVSLFSPDICSSINLVHVNSTQFTDGVEGKQYVGTEQLFDNGTKYPEMLCFNGDRTFPSGVRDISKCKFGAPAFVSYPHFYLADPYYRKNIEGMHPNESEHTFKISLEPKTGIPLNVMAQLQLNVFLQPINGISMFQNVKELMIPMLWFRQTAVLTSDYASQVKTLLILPSLGVYTGYGILGSALLIFFISLFLTCRNAWKDQETEQLLGEKSL